MPDGIDAGRGADALIRFDAIYAICTAQLPEAPVAAELNMERLLLDLHSGRVFGSVGVLLVDLVSVVVALLLLSGAAMWYVRR